MNKEESIRRSKEDIEHVSEKAGTVAKSALDLSRTVTIVGGSIVNKVASLEERLDAALEENRRLREALEPFGLVADYLEEMGVPPHSPVYSSIWRKGKADVRAAKLCGKDFYDARAALAAEGEEE